jgi:hypothetical protein
LQEQFIRHDRKNGSGRALSRFLNMGNKELMPRLPVEPQIRMKSSSFQLSATVADETRRRVGAGQCFSWRWREDDETVISIFPISYSRHILRSPVSQGVPATAKAMRRASAGSWCFSSIVQRTPELICRSG